MTAVAGGGGRYKGPEFRDIRRIMREQVVAWLRIGNLGIPEDEITRSVRPE